PSGVDVEAARRGGVGFYTREDGWQALDLEPFTLCVGLTGKPRDTRAMVAKVSQKMTPAILREIGAICAQKRITGALMNQNQSVLVELGASSPELDHLCTLARDAGAQGAKLTGAGGGGAAIALAPGREAQVLGAWRAAGFDGFTVRIPCTA